MTCTEEAVTVANGWVFPKHAKEVSKWIQGYDVTAMMGREAVCKKGRNIKQFTTGGNTLKTLSHLESPG